MVHRSLVNRKLKHAAQDTRLFFIVKSRRKIKLVEHRFYVIDPKAQIVHPHRSPLSAS